MSAKDDMTIPLSPGMYYHIFNRGIAGLPIFFEERNYHHFIQRLGKQMSGFWDLVAWSLLENHFHLLVKIKKEEEILKKAIEISLLPNRRVQTKLGLSEVFNKTFQSKNELIELSCRSPSVFPYQQFIFKHLSEWIVSEALRRMLLGYAKAINHSENRKGSLFQKPFRRKKVENSFYLKQLIRYIHFNSVHHNYTDSPDSYPWSSFIEYSSDLYIITNKSLFQSVWSDSSEFLEFHLKENNHNPPDLKYYFD